MILPKRVAALNLNNHRKELCIAVVNCMNDKPENISELFEHLCNHYLDSKEGKPLINIMPLQETVNTLQEDENSVNLQKELEESRKECSKLLTRLGDKHIECAALQAENVRLETGLEFIDVNEGINTVNVGNALYSDLNSRLQALHKTTSNFMRDCYKDESLRDLTSTEMLFLMLDYVERDPSEEFPFEEAAVKIFAEPKPTPVTYGTDEE